MYLGIIVTRAGMVENLRKVRKDVDGGRRSIEKEGRIDISAFFAVQGFTDEELNELWRFRNRLCHSSCLVNADGSLRIFERRDKSQHDYSPDEIEQYARKWISIDINNRVQISMTVYSKCSICGQTVESPDILTCGHN